jgi:defect-in-organelle-trafficking protein DotD
MVLAGCAMRVPVTVDVPGMPNPEIAMRRSMDHVAAEMEMLGRRGPRVAAAALPPVVPAELGKVIAFEWDGPVVGAVEKLAQSIGYQVVVRGPWNTEPLAIRINTGPKRVFEVFQEIGVAAGDGATVELDPQNQRVEIIHHV